MYYEILHVIIICIIYYTLRQIKTVYIGLILCLPLYSYLYLIMQKGYGYGFISSAQLPR